MKRRARKLRWDRVAIIAMLLVCAFVSLSNAFGTEYEKHTVMHTVARGETMYGICSHYYDIVKCEKNTNFNEFWSCVAHDEANSRLSANGRWLQPGDVVAVNYYTAVIQK